MDDLFGLYTGGERAALLLRALYESFGYKKYRMAKFEEYDFYTAHKDFLPGGQILAFTDLNGKLMALKPDVTMSIVKRTRATRERPERLYYNENIYRPARGAHEFREISQIGVEYIGGVTAETNREIVEMALKSLARVGGKYILDVSHNGFLAGLYEDMDLPAGAKYEMTALLTQKNAHGLSAMLDKYGVDAGTADKALNILNMSDAGSDFLHSLREAEKIVVNKKMDAALSELYSLYSDLGRDGAADALRLDFTSFAGGGSYYNGLMMRGYTDVSPRAVLSGGRYDPLLRDLGFKDLEAIGFAVYLDEIDATARPNGMSDPEPETGAAKALRVALPKGRMGDKAYKLFDAAGYGCDCYDGGSRKLSFTSEASKVSYLMVKPQDVAVYVERGAADVGVVGKDTLLETAPDIYELLDLRFGGCDLAVAAPDGYSDDPAAVLRVATKYPNVARGFYARQNREIEIIKLNGSIELAPVLGVSDVIVDIVETGATLKENNLSVREVIGRSSARLIANVISYKFRHRELTRLINKIRASL